jgi:hypothetical protein
MSRISGENKFNKYMCCYFTVKNWFQNEMHFFKFKIQNEISKFCPGFPGQNLFWIKIIIIFELETMHDKKLLQFLQ